MADLVLVVVRRPEIASSLLSAAQRMAGRMGGARISVLAVREPIQVTPLGAEALIAEAESVIRARQQEQHRLEALHESFERWVADSNIDAQWAEVEGSAPSIIGDRGSRADMIVAGQPLEEDRLARQAFSAALFGTDRPVLLVPPNVITEFGRRVAIAWRDDKHAIKAVMPALRYFTDADQVHVLTGIRAGQPSPEMPRVFREHNIAAELHVLPIGSEPFAQTLLDAAHRFSVDLLVMGAYAHSPLRELILGGVTRYILDHTDLPVLMRH
jgi:nucleotide-binding universal stress UspA family protein